MPPKSKSRNAPNQHDKRHESGLAPPGKRVAKKQSSGQLNGQPNGKPVSTVPPPALPSTGLNQGFKFPRLQDPASATETAPQTATRENAVLPESVERDRTYSDASLEEGGRTGGMGDNQDSASTAPNVEAHLLARKNSAPCHAACSPSAISTILGYYPLRDAISILILLLSLPPTLVLVIQTLFASLTFVPPTAGISLSTLTHIKEMFNSSNLGYPALATILIVDLIFWVCWLPVWKPVQGIFLDLSQAVIAVSLSGAAASTGGPTYSIATTALIVCVVHVLRYRAIHLTALDYFRSVIHKTDIGIPLAVPSSASQFFTSTPIERGWLYTVIRTILGIHIVSQGVTTCIRRSLVKANEQSANLPAITKSDPEAAAGSEPNSRSNTGFNDSVQHPAAAPNTDGRPPGSALAHRDNKSRETSAKKKRKQANQVRSQQPLWAAIASTKVTFVKEMEQRDAADDAREAARMDNTTRDTIAGTIHHTTDRIWICEVRDIETFFSVELSPDTMMENADRMEEGTSVSAGIDKSKPFYIRINGAAWSSTRIMPAAHEDDTDNKRGDCYDGEIFGLAPLSSYHCEIVAFAQQNVLCSASIITQPAPTAEQVASASSQPQHQALRPSSPITTLKQSIQSAEAKLNETRNRSKKTRKDQRAVHSDIKREINILKSKLESSGGADDKLEKRIMQISQHKNQAEEATIELKKQIDALGEIPEDDVDESEVKRRKWQSASYARSAANKDLESAKADADRDLGALKSEISQAESKRDKVQTRLKQRTEELEKLVSKRHADLTAKQKRDMERAQVTQRRENEENEYRRQIASIDTDVQHLQQKAHDAYQEIAGLQSWSTQPQPHPSYSSPPTPENAMPGANGSLGSPQSNGFPAFASHQFQSPFHSAHPSMSNPQTGPRGRSSSMLSEYSGFTDDGQEYSITPEPRHQYTWPMQANASVGASIMDTGDRKASEGSGSASLTNGSTGSNSPRPDAKPFIPGTGPIGPPGRSKEKAPQSPVATSNSASSGR